MPKSERLGRNRRVRQRKDFLRIQSKGRKLRSAHLLLAISACKEEIAPSSISESQGEISRNFSRIGITVTTKVDKLAVHRNLFKRRIRELFRRERRLANIPVDIVVIALAGATEINFYKLSEEFRFLLKKAGFYRTRSC